MAQKKKPGAKKPGVKKPDAKPTAKPSTAFGRLEQALEEVGGNATQAVAVLVALFVGSPEGVEPSPMERLVLAAEKQADARLRIASTFEATEARKAREAEADDKRAAELHAQELKAAEDHVATVRGFFARVQAGEVRITPTGPSGGPEVAFGAPPAASPARQVAEAVARETGLEVLDPPQA